MAALRIASCCRAVPVRFYAESARMVMVFLTTSMKPPVITMVFFAPLGSVISRFPCLRLVMRGAWSARTPR